jgi:ribonuclease HII
VLFDFDDRPLALERQLTRDGFKLIAGIDEAGRGALAGPVVAAAVILPPEIGDLAKQIRDSKKLTPERREDLFPQICQCAVTFGIGVVNAQEIDRINILQATLFAMGNAISQLEPPPDLCLVDGNHAPKLQIPTKSIIKGDERVTSIAAASIIAKVTRDHMMVNLAVQYPKYHFDVHKGYGTELHMQAIAEAGPSPLHRKSFSLMPRG